MKVINPVRNWPTSKRKLSYYLLKSDSNYISRFDCIDLKKIISIPRSAMHGRKWVKFTVNNNHTFTIVYLYKFYTFHKIRNLILLFSKFNTNFTPCAQRNYNSFKFLWKHRSQLKITGNTFNVIWWYHLHHTYLANYKHIFFARAAKEEYQSLTSKIPAAAFGCKRNFICHKQDSSLIAVYTFINLSITSSCDLFHRFQLRLWSSLYHMRNIYAPYNIDPNSSDLKYSRFLIFAGCPCNQVIRMFRRWFLLLLPYIISEWRE